MPVEIPVEQPRRRWRWWLLGLTLVVVIFTAGRLTYPKFRQQQLINQLKQRGFSFTRRGITGDWREAWVQQWWLPQSLRNAYNQEIVVSNHPGRCRPEDFQLLTELVRWDEEWFHSPSRTWMSLNLQDVTDQDLIWLQPRMQYLAVSGSRFTDDGMAPFRRTPHLQSLYLDAPQVGDRGLAHLAGLKDLVHLRLNGRHITDAGLAHLAGLTKLQKLRLANTRVTGAGLKHLAALTNLVELDLTNSQVTGSGLEELAKLPQLHTLTLNGCPLDDAGLKYLAAVTNLKQLDLSNSKVTGSGLDQFAKLPQLHSLILNGCPLDDAGLVQLINVPSVVVLQIASTKITDLGLTEFTRGRFKAGKQLWSLNLRDTAITDAAIPDNGRVAGFRIDVTGTRVTSQKVESMQRNMNFYRGRQYGVRVVGP